MSDVWKFFISVAPILFEKTAENIDLDVVYAILIGLLPWVAMLALAIYQDRRGERLPRIPRAIVRR